jgi:hypothetical protein
MKALLITTALIASTSWRISIAGEYLGNLSANPYLQNSTANPYGAGNSYNPNSVNNPYGTYGSPYSPHSATNPYATDAPRLYDSEGNYRGKLSANPYDPDSISNPYGRFGNPYSPESINNSFGAGAPYRTDSPRNRYGDGWKVIGRDEFTPAGTYGAVDSYSSSNSERWGSRTGGLFGAQSADDQARDAFKFERLNDRAYEGRWGTLGTDRPDDASIFELDD